jgi:hypothetical protein
MENEILGGTPAEETAAPPAEVVSAADPEPASNVVSIHPHNEAVREFAQVLMDKGADLGQEKPAQEDPKSEPAVSTSENPFEKLFHEERLAHDFTKAELAKASAALKRAAEMGFPLGAGIHRGA